MNMQIVIYVLYGWALLTTTATVLMLFLTPALQFLICRIMKNKVVLALISKSNRVKFALAEPEYGVLHTKKDGIYDETPQSMFLAYRIPFYVAYSNYAHTVDLNYPKVVNELRKQGHNINTFADFQQVCNEHPELNIQVKAGETVNLGGMLHMFPSIDDPHVREAEKITEVALSKKLFGGDYKKWLILLLIGGVVAYVVWKLFMGGNAQPVSVICEYPGIVNQAANATMGI